MSRIMEDRGRREWRTPPPLPRRSQSQSPRSPRRPAAAAEPAEVEPEEQEEDRSASWGFESEMLFPRNATTPFQDGHAGDPRWWLTDSDPNRQEANRRRVQRRVVDALRNDGKIALIVTEQQRLTVGLDAVPADEVRSYVLPMYHYWSATSDPSVEPERWVATKYPMYGWGDLEIVSQVMVSRKSGAIAARSNRNIRSYCDTMRRAFRMRLARSTGTHVHVGLKGAAFDLTVLKKLVILVWLAEPVLKILFAPWRMSDEAEYSGPISVLSDLAADDIPQTGPAAQAANGPAPQALLDFVGPDNWNSLLQDTRQRFKMIWDMDVENLVRALQDQETRIGLNLEQIGRDDGTGTVEFRYRELASFRESFPEPLLTQVMATVQGTLDAEVLRAYAQLCLRLVEAARFWTAQQIHDFLKALIRNSAGNDASASMREMLGPLYAGLPDAQALQRVWEDAQPRYVLEQNQAWRELGANLFEPPPVAPAP